MIQRAARLQEWPALTAPDWGPLRYPAFRNRVEGVALGLMAGAPAVGTPLFSATGGPWDWACEVACACCGLVWHPDGAGLQIHPGRDRLRSAKREIVKEVVLIDWPPIGRVAQRQPLGHAVGVGDNDFAVIETALHGIGRAGHEQIDV